MSSSEMEGYGFTGGGGCGTRSAYLNVDSNPTSHVKPRQWLSIKFGYETRGIRDVKLLDRFTNELRSSLYEKGVLLSPAPMHSMLITDNVDEVHSVMERSFSGTPDMPLPVLFLIDDYEPSNAIKIELEKVYKNNMYIFAVFGNELETMRLANSFEEARLWCDDFAEGCVRATEGSLDFDPRILDENYAATSIGMPAANYGGSTHNGMERNQGMVDNMANGDRHARGSAFERVADARGKERINGYASADQTAALMSEKEKWNEKTAGSRMEPELVLRRPTQRRNHRDLESSDEMLTADYSQQATTSNNDCPQRSSTESSPAEVEMVGLDVIETALQEYADCPIETQDLVCHIAGPFLFARFSHPFPQLMSNVRVLQLLRLALTTGLRSKEVTDAMELLLGELAKSRYLIELCDYYGRAALEDSSLSGWAGDLFEMLKLMGHVFLVADQRLTKERKKMLEDSWSTFYELLNALPPSFWDDVPRKEYEWLSRAVASLLGTPSPTPSRSPAEQYTVGGASDRVQEQQQQTVRPVAPTAVSVPVVPRGIVPAPAPMWLECEAREPPDDFRLLSEMPVRKDIYQPKRPYIRRAVTSGAYKDAGHYLDVMFRLLREDMVSPLRDGLDLHRRTGSSRFLRNKGEEGLTSDIGVFRVTEVGGEQVKFQTGEKFRYVALSRESLQLATTGNGRSLLFGQIVCLSMDGFNEDLQLAVVTERRDDTFMNNGHLGLWFLDGSTVKKGGSYSLAEPSCYLEAYQHVLKVIKSVNRYAPLPMERYLVHGKKDVRQPLYMRTGEDEDRYVQENAQVITHYEHERLLGEAERIQKDERRRARRIEGSYGDDSQESSSSSDEFEAEDRWMADTMTPIIPRRMRVADESLLERIRIRGEIYTVASLKDDYRPSNLDDSQREAFVTALTSELAVIQGPPGTGKTFLGVEIVRTLLENRQRYANTRPILLVCYTNTALDQFLEKIVEKVPHDIGAGLFSHDGPVAVRLGSKSESQKLNRAGVMRRDVLNEWKTTFAMEEDQEYGRQMGRKRRQAAVVTALSFTLGASKSQLIGFNSFKDIMSDEHRSEFTLWAVSQLDTKGERICMDEALACWLLDKSFASSPTKGDGRTRRQSGGDSDSDFEITPTDNSRMKSRGRDMPDGDYEGDEELTLEQMFKNINLKSALKSEMNDDEVTDEFEVNAKWDMVNNDPGCAAKIIIFGNEMRPSSSYPQSMSLPMDPVIISSLMESQQEILRSRPCTTTDYQDIRSILSITKQRRWELYQYWMRQMRVAIRNQLPVQIEKFKKACDKTQTAFSNLDAKVFRRALVIGATTTGAAKARPLLEKIGCKILVVEECAEVLEAHTLSAMLPSLEHAVFIGDHQQLRPNPAVFQLAREYGLEVSLFERLIKNEFPFKSLKLQHRMNAQITETIVRPHFYNDLIDHESVLEYPAVGGMDKSLFFWNHLNPEQTPYESASYSNPKEIEMVCGLADYLCKQGVYAKEEITIIATYSAQTELLRKAITNQFGLNSQNTGPAIAVETVDSFQGKENKIIIVSLVRSMGETIGFLAVANRITVALTRAQHGMYIVGNMNHLAHKSTMWNGIMDSMVEADVMSMGLPLKCRSHGTITEIYQPAEFQYKCPDGGCSLQCGTQLPCGHICMRRCHPIDDHFTVRCTQPCAKRCQNKTYNHVCRRMCYEDCGLCSVMEEVTLACGHSTTAPCHKTDTAVCIDRCLNLLPCDHQCMEVCGKECTVSCVEPVLIPHACGHTSQVPCFESLGLVECSAPCLEQLPCGHQCAEKCGQECTFDCKQLVAKTLPCTHEMNICCYDSIDNQKCEFGVVQKLEACGHTVAIPCHAGADSTRCPQTCDTLLPCGHKCEKSCGDCQKVGHECKEICGKLLLCGHKCRSFCGKPCGPCGFDCRTSCTHQRCGNGEGGMARTSQCFGRNCSQLCALCPKPCDNRCEHRSCSRKCWEVCDVKACDEPCMRTLECRHACLGVCGEKCPRVCGTCNQSKYLQTVQVLKETEPKKIHRLLELPSCGHVFPVQHIDEIVRESRARKSLPLCPFPGCGRPIAFSSIRRYSKIHKKMVLEQYKAKEMSLVPSLTEAQREFNRLSNSLGIMRKSFDKMRSSVRRNDQSRLNTIVSLVKEAVEGVVAARECGQDKCAYWMDFVGCLKSLHGIVSAYSAEREIPRFIRDPPELQLFCDDICPGGKLQAAVTSNLDEVILWLRTQMSCEMSGVVMPKARFLLQKTAFYLTVAKMASIVMRGRIDLTSAQSKEVYPIATKFINSGVDSNFEGIYSHFVNCIYDKVMVPNGLESNWTGFEEFEMPPF